VSAESKIGQRLLRVLLQNLGLKLFSLMVSIGLFVAVHGSEVGQRSLDVPVLALLPPESSGKILVGDIPENVKVTLSGSRSVLQSINRMDPVQVDLRSAPTQYTFETAAFDLPTGIEVEVVPSVLRLSWESRGEQKVNVRAMFTGNPDPSFELSSKVGVTPSRVVVRGPRSKVLALAEVPTEPISLTSLGIGSHRRHVALAPLSQYMSTHDVSDVVVEFAIEPRKEQRRLRKLPIAVLGVLSPVQVRPPNVDVILSAPERTLAELDPDHIIPVIDLSEITPSAGAQPVSVRLRGVDDAVRVLRIEPAEVLVRAK
jgi:YbbR-like protein